MGLMETGNDFRGDATDERKWARRRRTLQLDPTPGDETYVVVVRNSGPHRAYGLAVNRSALIVGSYKAWIMLPSGSEK
ncbi:hypothetical protein YTPLAS72_07680 [Nitrospira sp.]|nr:hypothetical protein YTPLAS72_07680 [Nitrospira sp.]